MTVSRTFQIENDPLTRTVDEPERLKLERLRIQNKDICSFKVDDKICHSFVGARACNT